MKTKIKNYLKDNYMIVILLVIATIIQSLSLLELGYKYNLNSDDLGYIMSGITFFKTGHITMHGVLSAQIMPGLTFLIAFFCLFFGTKSLLIIALKIMWLIMGIMCILVLYKIIRLFTTNQYLAIIPCLFLLAPDFLWMHNLILTETPFMLTFLLLIYYSFRFIKNRDTKSYLMIILWYIICLFMRPTISLYPLCLAVVLLLDKYSFKDLIKKGLIAGCILLLVLTPWIYRNYKLFHRFIPLTYGMGNPLLLGTYQGYGYPSDEELDYISNVDNKMSQEMQYYLKADTPRDHHKVYYLLEYDALKAKYRMQEWFQKDKKSMLHSYFLSKPKIMVYSTFYWDKIFNLDNNINFLFRKIDLFLFSISIILIFLNRKLIKEFIFLILIYGYHIALYSYSFASSRYAITLYPIRFIIIGFGLKIIYDYYMKRKEQNNESTSNNTRLQRRVKHPKHYHQVKESVS